MLYFYTNEQKAVPTASETGESKINGFLRGQRQLAEVSSTIDNKVLVSMVQPLAIRSGDG